MQWCFLGDSPRGERGAILLEFGLVFPFLFLLLVCSVEFSRGLRIREMMSVVSREAAYQAFRQCASETAPRVCTSSLSTTDACLTRIHIEIGGLAQAVLGTSSPFTLTMSVYAYNPATDEVLQLGISRDTNGNSHPTRFDEGSVRSTYLPLLQAHKVITVSEVTYDFLPFFNVGWLAPGAFYESTIY